MMIRFSAIAAVRRNLKTVKFSRSLNSPHLQCFADALTAPHILYRKGMYLGFGECNAIQHQERAVGFRANGLDTETQEAHHLLILQGHTKEAGQMAGVFAQNKRGLLWGNLLQALHKLSPAWVRIAPFLKFERRRGVRVCHSILLSIRFAPDSRPIPCRVA